jgi:hypothetical protein
MEAIKVHVYVTLAMAVAGGRAQYGEAEIALGEADLVTLSAEAREILGDYVGTYRSKRLEVSDVTPAFVCGALEVEAKARAEVRAKEAAMEEQGILAALAAPIGDWIASDRTVRPYPYPSGCYLGDRQIKDPRIVGRREAVEASSEMCALREAASAKLAAEAARREEEKAARAMAAAERVRLIAALLVEASCRTSEELCSLRERHAAGVLPQDELEELARDEFLPLRSASKRGLGCRYAKLHAPDVEHSGEASCCEPVKFRSLTYTGAYDAEQWEKLKAVKADVASFVDYMRDFSGVSYDGLREEVRKHNAWCPDTDCVGDTYRYGYRLTLEWAGMTLVRELALW